MSDSVTDQTATSKVSDDVTASEKGKGKAVEPIETEDESSDDEPGADVSLYRYLLLMDMC